MSNTYNDGPLFAPELNAHERTAIELAAGLADFLVETGAMSSKDGEQIFDLLADSFIEMNSEDLLALGQRIVSYNHIAEVTTDETN